jgi:DNA transformation protein
VDEAAIQDLFGELGPVRCRRMFGGRGIYAGEVMFALEAGGEIFLKVDDGSRAAFEAAGSRPFVYGKEGRADATS